MDKNVRGGQTGDHQSETIHNFKVKKYDITSNNIVLIHSATSIVMFFEARIMKNQLFNCFMTFGRLLSLFGSFGDVKFVC